MEQHYRDYLVKGLESYDIALTEQQIDLLLAYHQLLIKWNKAYNLTAIRDPLMMITRHILDSISVAPYLQGQRFIDVGTGAGLPGVILAIIYPDKHFDLLDSNGKKTRFLFQVKTQLKLDNISIHHCRVESLKPAIAYDGVLSRAFATLADMVNGSSQLLNENGCYYAMKGLYPKDELAAIENNCIIEQCIRLQVPNDDAERHLIIMSNKHSDTQ